MLCFPLLCALFCHRAPAPVFLAHIDLRYVWKAVLETGENHLSKGLRALTLQQARAAGEQGSQNSLQKNLSTEQSCVCPMRMELVRRFRARIAQIPK